MNIVLFLGAGFSAPFGQPVMNDFLRVAAGSNSITKPDKLFIEELRLEAGRANRILESSPTNLEDILSFAVMGDRLGLFGGHGKIRGSRIKDILRKIYATIRNPGEYWSQFSVFRRLFGVKDVSQINHELAIITTNYDLNIESTLQSIGLGSKMPFEYEACTWDEPAVTGRLYSNNGIPTFKLHGSLNWFEKIMEDQRIIVDDRIVSPRTFDGTLPFACVNNYPVEFQPLIIPPTFLKPEFNGPLLDVWAGAATALRTAEIVVFVGYSFPASDVEMRFFLARSLGENGKLLKVIVVDLEAEDLVKRLRAQNSGFGSHFRDMLTACTGDWRKVRLPLDY